MPILESLVARIQGSRGGQAVPSGDPLRDAAREPARAKDPRGDTSLTAGGDDTWTPSSAMVGRSSLARTGGPGRSVGAGVDSGRRVCGNPLCPGSWTAPWKSREHPIFEGRWACSAACAAALVRTALARETGDWPEDDSPVQHQHRIPLGLELLAHGWVTHPRLQRALDAQRASGSGRIGEWLIAECGLSEEQVTRGLSAQWNCPVLTLDGFSPQTMAAALPRLLIAEYGALPLRVAGGRILYVGFEDRLDAAAAFAIERMTGLKTESGVMGETAFRRARQRLLESDFPPCEVQEQADRDRVAGSVAATIAQTRPIASRLLKLHRYYWLRVWSGGECRPGSALPLQLNGVSDYLFTVESHSVARPAPPGRAAAQSPEHSVAEPLKAAAPGAVSLGQAEVTGGRRAGSSLEDLPEEDRKSPSDLRDDRSGREVALALIDQEVTLDAPHLAEGTAREAAELADPIDGEYLPADPLPSTDETSLSQGSSREEATGFLPLHRRAEWSPSHFWSRIALPSLRRGQHPASDPGPEG